MIVVCNTTPLINLAAIGEVDLLARLFDRIIVPEQVSAELHEKTDRFPMLAPLINAPFVQVRTVQNHLLLQTLRRDLDDGEAAALVLAIEIRADLVLMDEIAGREMAAYYRLPVIGSIGCLIEAKSARSSSIFALM